MKSQGIILMKIILVILAMLLSVSCDNKKFTKREYRTKDLMRRIVYATDAKGNCYATLSEHSDNISSVNAFTYVPKENCNE